MEIIKTPIDDLFLIKPIIFKDQRGYFFESYKDAFINEYFPGLKFIQDNESKSSHGVLRGLHFQVAPYEQYKLVRVIEGEIQDVVVDLRTGSKTYGKYYSVILSSENKKQLLVPTGFAHGFLVLSKSAIVQYKVNKKYDKNSERHISFDDKDLSIEWGLPLEKIKLSQKDSLKNTFQNFQQNG